MLCFSCRGGSFGSFFFFQAEDGIRDHCVTGVQTCALPISGVNIGFAVADFFTQVILVIVGIVLVFAPDLLVRQVDFGTVPTVGDFLIAIPVAMVAYTGIETISNLAEEARDVGKTIPRGMAL